MEEERDRPDEIAPLDADADANAEAELFNEIMGNTQEEEWSFERAIAEIERKSELKGDRDDAVYLKEEAASLCSFANRLAQIARGRDTRRTEFQEVALEDAAANLRSDVLALLDVDIDDAGRKGDIFYTALGLLQSAFDIGRNTGHSGETSPDENDEFDFAISNLSSSNIDDEKGSSPAKKRRARSMGVQARVIPALKSLYAFDPVIGGMHRSELRRAIVAQLGLPQHAVSLATLDRAREAAWPLKDEADEADDT